MDPRIEELVARLDSDEQGVRLLAIQELASMAGPEAKTALRVAAESPDATVRSMARKALAGRWSREAPVHVGGDGHGVARTAGAAPSRHDGMTEDESASGTVEAVGGGSTAAVTGGRALVADDGLLQPLSFVSIFVEGARLCLGRFFTVLFFMTIFYGVPVLAWWLVMTHGAAAWAWAAVPEQSKGVAALVMLVGLPLLFLPVVSVYLETYMAAFTAVAVDHYLARPASARRNLHLLLRRLPALITAVPAKNFLLALLIALSALSAAFLETGLSKYFGPLEFKSCSMTHYLALAPFLLLVSYAAAKWAFTAQVALLENRYFISAVARSARLVRGANLPRMLFVSLLLLSLLRITGKAFSTAIPAVGLDIPVSGGLGDLLACLVLLPYCSACFSLLFLDTCARNESLSVKKLELLEAHGLRRRPDPDTAGSPSYLV